MTLFSRWSLGMLVVLGLFSGVARAEVKLPNVFSDHMVLQRDMQVPVWGTAAPGEKITVKFRDQEKSATAGENGQWRLHLAPLKAGGPDSFSVSGTNNVEIKDVLVGEVWVGSGQSNMAGGVKGYANGDEVLAKAAAVAYPQLRLLKSSGRWQESTPDNNNGFSAILFAFGQKLHDELKVPVGLLVGAVGGTPSGYWLSEDAYSSDVACQAAIKKFAAAYNYDEQMKKYEQARADWGKAAEAAKKDGKDAPKPPTAPQRPGEARGKIGNLYEAHVRPFVTYGVRGVLWDQGESGTAIFGVDQYTLMGALIRGWRKEWGQGDFPFLYIQKPSGGGIAWDATNPITSKSEAFSALPNPVGKDGDGGYRETHIKIMTYPQTAMATASDLGPGVHPVNKSGYGHRAAQLAMGFVYQQSVAIYGPVYKAHEVDGQKVRVRFDHVGQGLAFKQADKLQGFSLAGEDRVFQWADAQIDGDSVVLTSDKVSKPVAVRYAWGSKITWANLFNKDGLPALTFRTDAW